MTYGLNSSILEGQPFMSEKAWKKGFSLCSPCQRTKYEIKRQHWVKVRSPYQIHTLFSRITVWLQRYMVPGKPFRFWRILLFCEIFYDLLSKQYYFGLWYVTFRLFFSNCCLFFCCQIITNGHHLSKEYPHFSVFSTHVVIIAVVSLVAWNVNKFCVFAFAIPLFMLSNIADTVNKHTMTMAEFSHFSFIGSTWCFEPYLRPITQYKKVIITRRW